MYSRTLSKIRLAVSLVAVLGLCGGCTAPPPRFLHPFTTSPKGVDPQCIGTWRMQDEKLWLTIQRNAEGDTVVRVGPLGDSGSVKVTKSFHLDVLGFSSKSRNFADLSVQEIMDPKQPWLSNPLAIKGHTLISYTCDDRNLVVETIDPKRLRSFVDAQPRESTLRTGLLRQGGIVIITSKTPQLHTIVENWSHIKSDAPIVFRKVSGNRSNNGE